MVCSEFLLYCIKVLMCLYYNTEEESQHSLDKKTDTFDSVIQTTTHMLKHCAMRMYRDIEGKQHEHKSHHLHPSVANI